jgi:hypothetical protein
MMKKLNKFLLAVMLVCISLPSAAQKIEHGKRFRALIIGMDGTKGVQFHESVFINKESPHIKMITENGQYTTCLSVDDAHCARAHLGHRLGPDYFWVTSPGWATVLSGVNTNKHLVKENDFESQRIFVRTSQQFPTFLYQLKQKGLVAAAGGVGNFLSSIGDDGSVSAGILDYECGEDVVHQQSSVIANAGKSCNANYRKSFNGDDEARDAKLTVWLQSLIEMNGEQSPDVIMGVFDTIDEAGHHYNFGSNAQYLKARANVDAYIDTLMVALKKRVEESNEVWLVVITADHGGHGTNHSDALGDDEVIPFVISTFGSRVTLLQQGELKDGNVTQMDVSPSVLHWFDRQSNVSDGIVRSQYRWLD